MTYIEELEHELRAATQRPVRLAAARAPRPGAAAAGSVLSVGLILLVAFVLLQTRGSAPQPNAPTAPGVAPQILANFEAFRRPHSPADAVPENLRGDLVPINCTGTGDPDPDVVASDGQAAYQQVGCSVEPPAFRENLRVEPMPPKTPARHRTSARASRAHLGRIAKPTAQVKALIDHLQYDQSRRLQLPAGRGTVWLIPSGGWLCDLVRSRVIGRPLFACEPIGEVIAKPPLWPGLQSGGFYIGVEPDAITRVAIQPPGGAARPLQLHDHTIAAWVGRGGRLIQYSAAGSHSLQVQ